MYKPDASVVYKCDECGVEGVKLWRLWQTFLEHQSLLCAECSQREQNRTIDLSQSDQCGWRVPAVPTNNGLAAFWGYTSVPDDGVVWWRSLPMVRLQDPKEEMMYKHKATRRVLVVSAVEKCENKKFGTRRILLTVEEGTFGPEEVRQFLEQTLPFSVGYDLDTLRFDSAFELTQEDIDRCRKDPECQVRRRRVSNEPDSGYFVWDQM